jgi:hypothetical protein
VVSRGTTAPPRLPHSAEPKPRYATRASAITEQRDRRMSELQSLGDGLTPGSFADKARTLLTHRWARATWRSRENILRTVDWLMQMERVRRGATAEQRLPSP